MNVSAWIARRYFFSRRKRSFISWLSILSMLGVGVGTMALIIVLSVFNGMDELNRQLFKTFEADLTILPREGKRFRADSALLARIGKAQPITMLSAVAQDNALAHYANLQSVVQLKGVDTNYTRRQSLDSAMLEGRPLLYKQGVNYAIVADGVRADLSISPADVLTPLKLLYPERGKTISAVNPDAFRQQQLTVSGVFFIEARYQNFVITPIAVARQLFDFQPDEVTSLEIQLKPGQNENQAKAALQARIGDQLIVKTREDLNTDLFRAIRVEKLFGAVTLSFIILVASINIFFSLSMLVIEKKEDIRVLLAMGATHGLIRRIFLSEGAIIALSGALVGLLLGVGICLGQQTYGWISMGVSGSLVDAYPVRLDWQDVVLTACVVTLFTFLTSWLPASRAARIEQIR